jgi:crossover junction endodeoxyribonuclease RusA
MEEYSVYPLEFYVSGTPISLQGSNASLERWRSTVKEAAKKRIEETTELPWLPPDPLSLIIYYFPTSMMVGDIDNIIKPIMDALKGVAYTDDHSVEKVSAQKFEPELNREFLAPSNQLTSALDLATSGEAGQPVVYVKVSNALDWRRIA